MRVQESWESVQDFITALYGLAKNTAGSTTMIRDRIVVGVRESKFSERMQLAHAKLTLEKATTMARQSETVKKQQADLHIEVSQPSVRGVITDAQDECEEAFQRG